MYCPDFLARQSLPRSSDASGERPQVGLRLLCECPKHVTRRILNIVQRKRLECLGDTFRQANAFHEMDAKSAKYRGAYPLGMPHSQESCDARAHRISHDIGSL